MEGEGDSGTNDGLSLGSTSTGIISYILSCETHQDIRSKYLEKQRTNSMEQSSTWEANINSAI
jgi:hypothetical protein